MPGAFLVAGARSPVGRDGGALAAICPDDSAPAVGRERAARAGVTPEAIDEVILGAANQAGEDNRNVARMAALLAGLPDEIPAFTINRLCASGMTAATSAAQAIRAGDADVVLAGGAEPMTRAPWAQAHPARPGSRPGPQSDTAMGGRCTHP